MRYSAYCPSDYRMGDEEDPRSPWYEEPPEGAFRDPYQAVDWLMNGDETLTREQAEAQAEAELTYNEDDGLYWLDGFPD